MQQINKLLDLLGDLERSASGEGCKADLMVVSASALRNVMQAAKPLRADAAPHALSVVPARAETAGMTVARFQKIAEQLLAKHYGLVLSDTFLSDDTNVQGCIGQGIRPYEVIAELAEDADLHRIDLEGPYGVPSKAAITAADEDALPALSDGYAETIIGDRPDQYDALEIHGVRDLHESGDPRGTCCEIDDENPQFFSVYVHLTAGGLECVGDFKTHALATKYAEDLSQKYGWTILEYAKATAAKLAA